MSDVSPDDLTEFCESHRRHTVGCLACAAEECARTDLDLGDFLGHMERLGWPEVDA